MVSGPALAVVLAAALTFLVGSAVVDGAKWVGHHVVHVLKKIPHPHHQKKPDAE